MRVSGEKLRGFLSQWYTHCGPTLEAMSFKLGTRSFSLPTGVENSPSANPLQPLQPIVSTSFLPLTTSLASPSRNSARNGCSCVHLAPSSVGWGHIDAPIAESSCRGHV